VPFAGSQHSNGAASNGDGAVALLSSDAAAARNGVWQ
ncbi:unnamed protein product, partial [Urochloa humidicola]